MYCIIYNLEHLLFCNRTCLSVYLFVTRHPNCVQFFTNHNYIYYRKKMHLTCTILIKKKKIVYSFAR